MILGNRWRDKISSGDVVEMVSDGIIYTANIANGKAIPLVILNTINHINIEQSITLHVGIKTGHVRTLWGKSKDNRKIILNINIVEPSPSKFAIIFDILKQSGLVDIIIQSQLLLIQPGKPGDRLKTTMNNPRLLIEVPSSHFFNEWLRIYTKAYIKHFKNLGYDKKTAEKMAIALRKEWGAVRDMRLK